MTFVTAISKDGTIRTTPTYRSKKQFSRDLNHLLENERMDSFFFFFDMTND